jgi:hypothetical protein
MKKFKKIDFNEFFNSRKDEKVVIIKKKREREVYYFIDEKIFVKIWVPNWTQSEISSFAINSGFYNKDNIESLVGLLYDKSGPRGYVQYAGETAAESGKSDKDWCKFIRLTTYAQRYNFIYEVFKNSIQSSGTYTDLAPSNVILFKNKINFIDLESFRSFDLIFEKKRKEYEKFDLDAWWKPHETAKRDVNRFLKSYLKDCLDMTLDYEIDSKENFSRVFEELKKLRKD